MTICGGEIGRKGILYEYGTSVEIVDLVNGFVNVELLKFKFKFLTRNTNTNKPLPGGGGAP